MYTKKLYAGWADMDFNSHTTPGALLGAMDLLDRTSDFAVLPSSVSGRA